MMPLSRSKVQQRLSTELLEVFIIGGGIVGASVARDAAMRGLKVGLIDKSDFASGTSSRSSRLLHGGLRYLAQGRVGLVHEASVEKTIFHKIAPHLAAPLPFIFPTYEQERDWKLWQLKVGVKIYDLLCGGRNLGNSTWLSAKEVGEKVPEILTLGLHGGVRYYDGLTNDARLVIDSLRAASSHQAALLNYARLIRATQDAEGIWECLVENVETQECFTVKTRNVINAMGPWANQVRPSAVQLRLTKGVHLVLPRERLPVSETVVMTEGTRILFAIPWGERTILGTTDTDYLETPEAVKTGPEDVTYLLKIANTFFPGSALVPSDVISSWAGLRPLVADPNGKPSDISRSHEIYHPKKGWWDIAGGKLTTCRLMAEQALDRLLKADPLNAKPCRTKNEPILAASETGYSGLLPPTFSKEAVEHFCQQEWAREVTDVMIRRSSWHYYHADSKEKAKEVANWMAGALGWTAQEQAAQYERYLQYQS